MHLRCSFGVDGAGDEVGKTDVEFMLLAWRQALEVLKAGNLKGPITHKPRLLGLFSG